MCILQLINLIMHTGDTKHTEDCIIFQLWILLNTLYMICNMT